MSAFSLLHLLSTCTSISLCSGFNVLMELFINQKKKKISASSFEYFIDLYLNKSLGIYYEYVSLIYLLLL